MVAKRKTTKKAATTFTLLNIDVRSLIASHYPSILSIKESEHTSSEGEEPEEHARTVLNFDDETDVPFSQILHEKSNRSEYFYDPHKAPNKVWVTMYSFTHHGRQLPLYTKKPCWWCHHSFSSSPLGCPLEFCSGKKSLPKEYASTITDVEKSAEFFITDGLFCSYPCVLSYIHSKRMNTRYKRSTGLLSLMYSKTHGGLAIIPRAPEISILENYGGHLTIDEYRSGFGRFVYEKMPNRRYPVLVPSGEMYHEKVIEV